MGHWSSETATIILPKSAVASVKRALRQSHNDVRERALARAKEIHRSVRTTSKSAFDRSMSERSGLGRLDWSSGVRTRPFFRPRYFPLSEAVDELADQILTKVYHRAKTSVPVPTQADADEVIAKATAATTVFPMFGRGGWEATVTLEGSHLTWDRDQSRAHDALDGPMARVLWDALDAVQWTRGTGGDVLSQNEYSVEEFCAPSVVRSYGKGR